MACTQPRFCPVSWSLFKKTAHITANLIITFTRLLTMLQTKQAIVKLCQPRLITLLDLVQPGIAKWVVGIQFWSWSVKLRFGVPIFFEIVGFRGVQVASRPVPVPCYPLPIIARSISPSFNVMKTFFYLSLTTRQNDVFRVSLVLPRVKLQRCSLRQPRSQLS